jgi:hypothetical protein
MRIHFPFGAFNCPIKKDNYQIIHFLKDKIKNNKQINKEELKEFIDEEYILHILLDINNFYKLDTKYSVFINYADKDSDPLCSLDILPEKLKSDSSKVPYTLCYIYEESKEDIIEELKEQIKTLKEELKQLHITISKMN